MKITNRSILTGKVTTLEVDVTQEQLDRWKAGANIQDAMPDVPADLREFIMTGITPDEWKEHMTPPDDEEDPT